MLLVLPIECDLCPLSTFRKACEQLSCTQCSSGCLSLARHMRSGCANSRQQRPRLQVMLAPHMGNCILKVTNSLKTRSGFHRAVISGIMVSSELGFINTHKWCPECLPEGQPLGALG